MMRKLFEFIEKLNFRKIAKTYLIFLLALLISSVSIISYLMRNEILFLIDYDKIQKQVTSNGISEDDKLILSNIIKKYNDVKNVLIVDNKGNILFKANQSTIGNTGTFKLRLFQYNNNLFQQIDNDTVIFKVIKDELNILTDDFFNKFKISNSNMYNNNLSHISELTSTEVDVLNYVADKRSGHKIFIIRNIEPLSYAENLLESLGFMFTLVFAVYWIGLALWVYTDSNKKHLNSSLWGILVLITNLAGLVIYTIFKQNSKECCGCGFMQNKENMHCINCGLKLSNTCSNCNSIITNKNACFCSKCGIKLK